MPLPLSSVVKRVSLLSCAALLSLSACAPMATNELPSASFVSPSEGPGPDYVIGPSDQLNIFVWRQPELSTTVTVRPDGRITVPLIADMPATGKTPTELARSLEVELKTYVQNPVVSVIVNSFSGPFAQQVRVVGQAANPQAIPYRSNMTLLDVMISVGGLTEFAAGNRARLVRFDKETGTQKEFRLSIDSLLKDGNTKANVRLAPGDVIIIPESFF